MWISVRKKCKRFFLKYNRYARHENCSPSLDLLIVYKSKNLAVWSNPRKRENHWGRNEKNNGPTRLRASAHDAINRRPSRRISFTLATHSTHSRTVRLCGEGKRFTLRWRKLAASFFSSVTNPSIQASPRLTKDWLSLIEPATPTLFKLSSFPFLVSLFAKVIEHPDRDVRF